MRPGDWSSPSGKYVLMSQIPISKFSNARLGANFLAMVQPGLANPEDWFGQWESWITKLQCLWMMGDGYGACKSRPTLQGGPWQSGNSSVKRGQHNLVLCTPHGAERKLLSRLAKAALSLAGTAEKNVTAIVALCCRPRQPWQDARTPQVSQPASRP